LTVAHEDVPAVVGVPGHQIRRERVERHEAAVARDVRLAAEQVGRVAGAVHARALHRPRLAVAHVHVQFVVPARNEIGRVRLERDETAVRADDREDAGAVPLIARGVLAHALGRSRRAIAQEHLVEERDPGDEVVGGGAENDETAVGADIGAEARAVPLYTGVVDAHDLRRPGDPIVNEHLVYELEGVLLRNEVEGVRMERDEAAIGADSRPIAEPVRLFARAAHSDALGDAQEPIADKDVGRAVRVPVNEVRGFRREGDEPAVGADRGMPCHTHEAAVAISLTATAVHAQALRRTGAAIVHERVDEVVGIVRDEVARD
jgi:hypothetical protein